jgi:hypothetical protein
MPSLIDQVTTTSNEQAPVRGASLIDQQSNTSPTGGSLIDSVVGSNTNVSVNRPEIMGQPNNRISRGVNQALSSVGGTGQVFSEALGFDEASARFQQYRDEQDAQADLEAEQADGIMESLVEAIPAVGGILAATGAGALAFGPVGAAAGLFISSMGLNTGTVKEIQEAMGDSEPAGAGTIAIGAAASAVDTLSGGILTKTLRKPIEDAVKKTIIKQATSGAGKEIVTETGAGLIKSTSKAAGVEGTASGISQGILEVGANLDSGIGIDEDRLDAIASNVSMAAAFGAGFGGLGGAGVSSINKLRMLQDAQDLTTVNRDKGVYSDNDVPEPNPVAIEEHGMLKQGIGRMMGKATNPIRNSIARNSMYRQIAANAVQDRANRNVIGGDKKRISTVSAQADFLAGKQRKAVDTIFSYNKETQNRVLNEIAEGNVTSAEAKGVVKLFDEVAELAKEYGFNIERMERFLPLSLDVKRIRKNKDSFMEEILANAKEKIDPEGKFKQADYDEFAKNLPRYVTDLIENGGESLGNKIPLGSKEADLLLELDKANKANKPDDAIKAIEAELEATRMGTAASKASGGSRGKKVKESQSVDQKRFLSPVDQVMLEKWGNKKDNLADRVNGYVNSMSEAMAWRNAYGKDGAKLKQNLLEAALEDAKAGRDFDVKAHERLIDIANAQQRQYNRITDPKWRKRAEAMRTYQYIRTLPSATLSSLIEPFLIIEGIGGKAAMTAFADTISLAARRSARKFTKKTSVKLAELEDVVARSNISRHNALSATAQKFDADVQTLSGLERGLFKWNGLAAWTEYNRMMGAFAADNALKDVAKKLNGDNLSNRQRAALTEQLNEAGLTVDEAMSAYNKDTGTWNTNSPEYEAVTKAGINLVNDVVLRPDAGNRPLWQSDPHLMLVAQLKGWSSVFGNTIMTRWANKILKSGAVAGPQQAAKLSFFMAAYLTGLTGQIAIKDVARDGEYELDEKELGEVLLQALGQLGPLGMLTDSVAGGRSGPARTAGAFAFGPTGTQAIDAASQIAGVFNGSIDPDKALTEIGISLTAINLPMVDPVKDLMREALQ